MNEQTPEPRLDAIVTPDSRVLEHVVGSILATWLENREQLESFLFSFIFEREGVDGGCVAVHNCATSGNPEFIGIWFDVVIQGHNEQVVSDIHHLMQVVAKCAICEVRYSISEKGTETVLKPQPPISV